MTVQSNPSGEWVAVTPSDTVSIKSTGQICRAIYVGVAGDIVAVDANDVAVTFKGAAAGTIIPIRAKRINATSTTATDLVALY